MTCYSDVVITEPASSSPESQSRCGHCIVCLSSRGNRIHWERSRHRLARMPRCWYLQTSTEAISVFKSCAVPEKHRQCVTVLPTGREQDERCASGHSCLSFRSSYNHYYRDSVMRYVFSYLRPSGVLLSKGTGDGVTFAVILVCAMHTKIGWLVGWFVSWSVSWCFEPNQPLIISELSIKVQISVKDPAFYNFAKKSARLWRKTVCNVIAFLLCGLFLKKNVFCGGGRGGAVRIT